MIWKKERTAANYLVLVILLWQTVLINIRINYSHKNKSARKS